MDEAVEAALAFAELRNDTPVLVTADHENGGLSIVGGSAGDIRPAIRWIHTDHSGVPVPVYAFGPNAELFGHHLFRGKLEGFENVVDPLKCTQNVR